MKVLLSIKPQFVEKLINGSKRYEYRKSIFKKDVDSIIVYATKPCGMIVGEIIIDSIIKDSPRKLWEMTKDYSGIDDKFFFQYFCGREKAYAIKVKEFILYDKPINPYKDLKNFTPPQSYKYI